MLHVTSNGNPGERKGVAALRRPTIQATAMVMGGSVPAWANRYGNRNGSRYQIPPLAGAKAMSLEISPVNRKWHNKGLHRTAHKLRQIYAFGTIHPIAVTHYCACAPSGEP